MGSTFTPVKTFTTGETLTAATMQTYVSDNTDALHDPPRVLVAASTVQSIPNATWTAVAFDVEAYDTDSMHSNVTNNTRITLNRAGSYVISGSVRINVPSTARHDWATRVRRNGTVTQGQQGPVKMAGGSGVTQGLNVFSLRTHSSGDYIELEVWQNSSGARDTVQESGTPLFAATWMGGA